MPWIALGTLVVMNKDEWDHFLPIFEVSTPFNARWSGAARTVHVLRKGYGVTGGSKSGPKLLFPKLFLHRLGCSNRWF